MRITGKSIRSTFLVQFAFQKTLGHGFKPWDFRLIIKFSNMYSGGLLKINKL